MTDQKLRRKYKTAITELFTVLALPIPVINNVMNSAAIDITMLMISIAALIYTMKVFYSFFMLFIECRPVRGFILALAAYWFWEVVFIVVFHDLNTTLLLRFTGLYFALSFLISFYSTRSFFIKKSTLESIDRNFDSFFK